MEEKLFNYAKTVHFQIFLLFLITKPPKIESCALLGYYEDWSVVSSDVILLSF